MSFFAWQPMSDADYAALPPLVKKGEGRVEVIDGIVEQWCTPSGAVGIDRDAVESHVAAGGFILHDVALVDENTGEPIDLRELLEGVEQRLREHGESEAFRSRSDLFILFRRCRIDRCSCGGLNIRPRFVAYNTRFGDEASFARSTFGDGADLRLATFGRGAAFFWTTFGERADLSLATFGDGANLSAATFGDGADLNAATFGNEADFEGATFGDGAKFKETTFGEEGNLQDATFGPGASFQHARLPNADLRGLTGFVPDETYTRGAHFSARARDPWSRLRADFTGPRLIFNLLFLALFFLPFLARTVGYYAAGQTQAQVVEIIEAADDRLAAEAGAHPELVPLLRGQLDTVREHLPGPGGEDDPRWRPSRVWKAVIGADRGWMLWLPAVTLLLYNLGRAGMTFLVPAMRDAEERSGITPQLSAQPWRSARTGYCGERRVHENHCFKSLWAPWRFGAITWRWAQGFTEAYGWLIRPHVVLRVLFWFAVASFAFNALVWLSEPVWLPV